MGRLRISTRSAFSDRSRLLWRASLAGLSCFLFSGTLITPAIVFSQSSNAQSVPLAGEEFVGPFSSWTNLKTVYHAVGDGRADDTSALQSALSELGTAGHSPVLFIPSGRYRITRTLALSYSINLSVVGEDPASTSIVWDGPVGGTMLLVNGIAYSRFTRLTYDGRGKASVAVEQSWDNAKPNFDTGNEYSDHYFVDLEYGIHGGFKGYGFAETSIVRSHFVRNTKAGVALGNFNALDIWIWVSHIRRLRDRRRQRTWRRQLPCVRQCLPATRRSSDLYMKNTGGSRRGETTRSIPRPFSCLPVRSSSGARSNFKATRSWIRSMPEPCDSAIKVPGFCWTMWFGAGEAPPDRSWCGGVLSMRMSRASGIRSQSPTR